ncbi:MAG: acetate--CoA ligase family protein [Alphaproteobacteria bacterium]|nr:acetate--CoA ligase family protein [Alphaproteobacteria bacterium]
MTRKDTPSVLRRFADTARAASRLTLPEPDGKAVLADAGIAVPAGVFVAAADDPEPVCRSLKFPVAVKGVSADLIHKSDVGAVRLNVGNADALRDACAEIRDAVGDTALDGFLIEEMAPPGHEVIVGGLIDPQFGPVVMVGLGGVFTEIIADVAFRICPIERGDAAAMIDALQAAPLLDGARGGPVASREAIVDALVRIGGMDGLLWREQGEIAALDINPLIVSQDGAVAADARVVLREKPAPRSDAAPAAKDADAIRETFRPLFAPRSIAIIGASATRHTRSNTLIDQLLQYGFDREKLYPIHPTAETVSGLSAYASLKDTPEPVDYAYVAIPAAGVSDLLTQSKGRLRIAHVISSGFAEAGRQDLQDELLDAARVAGIRVVGPNCNGGHAPRGKLTFCYDAVPDEGSVGVILQSGGLGIDMIRRGNNRGLRFSGVMTVGNCADVGVADLLEFHLVDPDTRVVGLYLEGAPEGRRVFDLLRDRRPAKPVVILKGGRSERGREAAISHTGTLAGDDRIWQALGEQTGAVFAASLDDFIDRLLALQCLTPCAEIPTTRAVLLGNGGGASVLGVDAFVRAGVDVVPFSAETRDKLDALRLAAGATYANPVDLPQPVLVGRDGRDAEDILRIIFDQEDPQAVVMHINLSVVMTLRRGDDDPVKNLLDAVTRVKRDASDRAHTLLVLRSDGSIPFEEARLQYRELALDRGIPTYDEIAPAANAVAAIAAHERFLAKRKRDSGAA